ncbi:MAG: SDR family NAD(P)-dependent oxidoreductase [Acidimicrobiia bacterium]
MDELRFDGRVAVVTGAGRGIGRAHALLLASKGARVVVADLGCGTDGSGASTGPARDVLHEIESVGGDAVASDASVADERGAASIIATALEAFGRVDVVVNNAGIFDPAPFEELSADQFRAMIDVHYLGTVFVTQAAWPHLVAAGYGRIVNTTSEAFLGLPLLSSYAAAKGAILGLTRTLAAEGAPYGIRANCLAPQAGTRMAAALGAAMSVPSEVVEQGMTTMPPEMNAPVAAFLAHESCPLNGEVLHVVPGRISRLAVVDTRGFSKQAFTTEEVAAHLDEIMDPTDARVAGVGRPASDET